MNAARPDRLYDLLPALYRQVDAQNGGALRALLAVLQEEIDRLEEDIQAQYDNWFIETCDRWAIPYIADLVGVRGLEDPQQIFDGQRRRVANALRYRRRKGTLAVLEHALRDVSDWPAHGAEYYRYLAKTQHLDNLHPEATQTFDVRDWQTLMAVNTPFDATAHTADVRAIRAAGPARQRGCYNKKNVGLFLWRLRPYPVVDSPARPVRDEQEPPFRFTFDPLGRAVRLFNKPLPAPEGMHTTTLGDLPVPLSRTMLAADLAAYTRHPGEEHGGNSTFYGPERGLVIQYVDQAGNGRLKRHLVPPEALLSVPLWEGLDGLEIPAGKAVAIDVERGRFAFLGDDRPPSSVIPIVSYTYGFSDDIGGGPYERNPPLHQDEAEVLHVYVAEGCANESLTELSRRWQNPGPWRAQARTLAHAFAVWEQFYDFRVATAQKRAPRPTAVIQIVDNGLYGGRNVAGGNDLRVHLGRGARLSIVAAAGVRPTIRTLHNLVFSCESTSTLESAALERELHLNGLLIHSPMVIPASPFSGSLSLSIDIDHCTLMPGGIVVGPGRSASQHIRLTLRRSVVGPVTLASVLEKFMVTDSLIDGQGGAAVTVTEELATGQTVLMRTTLLGAVMLPSLTYAQDCLFIGPVTLEKTLADDTVRHCYLQALEIQTPSQQQLLVHCQRGKPGFAPVFTSTTYGDPAYGQLSLETPDAIFRGAANGSSPGAFSRLNEPQRQAGIQPILDEYLPLGLEAGLFYVT